MWFLNKYSRLTLWVKQRRGKCGNSRGKDKFSCRENRRNDYLVQLLCSQSIFTIYIVKVYLSEMKNWSIYYVKIDRDYGRRVIPDHVISSPVDSNSASIQINHLLNWFNELIITKDAKLLYILRYLNLIINILDYLSEPLN